MINNNDIYLIYLRTDLYSPLIGKVSILEKEPRIYISNCYIIRTVIKKYKNSKKVIKNFDFIPYPIHAKVNSLIIDSSSVLTIVSPSFDIINEYREYIQ